jgi:Spy/CpxP family protein refolding chaperone
MNPLNPRRRYTVAAILVSTLIAVGGTIVYAHSGGGQHGAMAHHSTESHLEHMQAMLTKIGASDAQKSQIEGLLKPALAEMKAAHESHSDAFRQFHEAVTAPSIDRARLESLRAGQVKSLDEASKRMVTAISDAAEVLSPDQRAALAAQIHKHHGG